MNNDYMIHIAISINEENKNIDEEILNYHEIKITNNKSINMKNKLLHYVVNNLNKILSIKLTETHIYDEYPGYIYESTYFVYEILGFPEFQIYQSLNIKNPNIFYLSIKQKEFNSIDDLYKNKVIREINASHLFNAELILN